MDKFIKRVLSVLLTYSNCIFNRLIPKVINQLLVLSANVVFSDTVKKYFIFNFHYKLHSIQYFMFIFLLVTQLHILHHKSIEINYNFFQNINYSITFQDLKLSPYQTPPLDYFKRENVTNKQI